MDQESGRNFDKWAVDLPELCGPTAFRVPSRAACSSPGKSATAFAFAFHELSAAARGRERKGGKLFFYRSLF